MRHQGVCINSAQVLRMYAVELTTVGNPTIMRHVLLWGNPTVWQIQIYDNSMRGQP